MRLRSAVALSAATIFVSLAGASTASAWAPADSATITPGVQTFTEGAQCTANFVFTSGADVYLGQAAHCSGTGGSTETNGCEAGSHPVGTPVEVTGASRPGTLAYNSWITMQGRGETDANTCQYNDFALIKLDPADHDKVNPSIPFFGGPTGTTATTDTGANVFSYGNSGLRAGIEQLSPKRGIAVQQSGGGWNHQVGTVTPGIPGDSGSAFVDGQGRAFGVLSTLALAPLPATNGVSDLSRAQAYMEANGGPDVTLAQGTEPFSSSRLL